MINSPSNQQVKHVIALCKRSKYRREHGVFVVEGIRMFTEIPKDRVVQVYMTRAFHESHPHIADGVPSKDLVSDEVMKAMADTQTPQGILALVKQYSYSFEDLQKSADGRKPLIMVLETIQDPGNLGTILRAGEGAGITGVLMNKDTADIYNPKVIRSTMGSIYRVPFFYTEDLQESIGKLKKQNIHVYAAHLKESVSYETVDYTKGTAFMIGNEAHGLTDETASLADSYIHIPMAGQVESLNAAVASSVLMYEASRQRRCEK